MIFLIGSVIALVLTLYYVVVALSPKYDYFKKKGIPQLPTNFIFGNSKEMVLERQHQGTFFRDVYFKFKEMGVSHGGIYDMKGVNTTWTPIDPEMIKLVLTKDFVHFSAHNRKLPGLFFNNLFHMDGEEWKDMRRKLTPTFTSGKMKMMFNIILEKTYGLEGRIDKMSKMGEPFDMGEILVRFTVDIIANCAFGIESKAIEGLNSDFFNEVISKFAEHPTSLIKKSPYIKVFCQYFGIGKNVGIPNFDAISNFFREVVRETLEYREKNHFVRKDFIHLLIQLKNKGAVTELSNEEDVFEKTVDKEGMSFEDIAGQCLLFLAAGFGTTSTTMVFAILELAHHQDVQQKLRDEVREVLQRHNGKLSYDALQEMKYCESVIYETLRKYPTLPIIFRLSTKDYRIPGTDSIIEKGSHVVVPVLGLHMDPDYFPDPERFDPERFSPENKNKVKDYTFLPFGEGPRQCLGLRFGMMQSKAGLATIVNNFKFSLNQKTTYPPIMSVHSMTPTLADEKLWLNAERIK